MKNYIRDFLHQYVFPTKAIDFLLTAFDEIGEDVFLQIESKCDNTNNYDVTQFNAFITDLSNKTDYHEYTIRLLIVLALFRGLEKRYCGRKIPVDIAEDTLRDILYKYNECYSVYGIHGIFSWDWYTAILDLRCFSIGRLQYELLTFRLPSYTDGTHYIKFGEPVISVHIPSSGQSFKDEYCQESYTRAFEFFKIYFPDVFSGDIPFVCWSWLLYPKNDGILPTSSNILTFMKSYDIIEEEPYENPDAIAWRIFSIPNIEKIETLPQNTKMQKAVVQHLQQGGKMGWGYGIFFKNNLHTIENEYLKISVSSLGAQLSSLFSKTTKTEYLWQGNPTYWANRAPILFPFIGRRYQGKYFYQGKEYSIRLHGLAKYYPFLLECKTDNEMVFLLKNNETTLTDYPFCFEFRVIYTLEKNALRITFNVYNPDESPLFFSIGAHPAFNVPFDGGSFEDYYLEFDKVTNPNAFLGSPDKLYMGQGQYPYPLKDGTKIPLAHSLFKENSIVLSDTSRCVSIKSNTSNTKITLEYNDFDFICFWKPHDSDAPFLCMEPWSALPATSGIFEQLEQKEHITKLSSNQTSIKSFQIWFDV